MTTRRSTRARVRARRFPKVGNVKETLPQIQPKEYSRVCAIALKLPGLEESTSYGTPALKVKGRLIARLRTEAEGSLALRCDFVDRQLLLQADSEAFYVTDHYLNYPMVLVRLEKVRRSSLPEIIQRAWRMVAPATLIERVERSGRRPLDTLFSTSDMKAPWSPAREKTMLAKVHAIQ